MFLEIIFYLFIFNLLWLLAANSILFDDKRDNYSYYFRRLNFPQGSKKDQAS
jgi:hypothetical protein